MRRFRPILALVLLATALASWWLVQTERPPLTPSAPADGPVVDYRIDGLDLTRMTPSGTPAHRLRAATLYHYRDDDRTELSEPRLSVFQGDEPPWRVDAARALLSSDGELLTLLGDVLIERDAGADAIRTRIVTSNLRVRPRQDYAETDEHVRVETDLDWLEGVGMQAWLRPPSRLQFQSNVKGYYVPR